MLFCVPWIIAQKLRTLERKNTHIPESYLDGHESAIIHDKPLLAEEQIDINIFTNGYLCRNLEIYLIYEPSKMCSMALLHSRFGRVIFDTRMLKAGGLYGENSMAGRLSSEYSTTLGLGHGLLWIKELDWALLACEIKHETANDRSIIQR